MVEELNKLTDGDALVWNLFQNLGWFDNGSSRRSRRSG